MQRVGQRQAEIEEPDGGGGEVAAFDILRGKDREGAYLVQLVAEASGVPALLLLHPSRCDADAAEARQLAMYLMHVVLQRSYADVGRYFGRDRTTVSHACGRVEDRRDLIWFESFVAGLEEQLATHLDVQEADRVAC